MPNIVPPQVQVIAWTHFETPADVPWDTDADGGQALAEFAGRACYQSWKKPNPATATNRATCTTSCRSGTCRCSSTASVTLYLTGIRRSLTHELIRHRHFSYSQLSQRYVPERDAAMVEPDVIAEDPELHAKFVEITDATIAAYTDLLEGLEEKFADVEQGHLAAQAGAAGRPRRAAQRHRDPDRRHRELPRVAALHRHARGRGRRRRDPRAGDRVPARGVGKAPNVFADFEVVTLPDGTEVATSPMVGEGWATPAVPRARAVRGLATLDVVHHVEAAPGADAKATAHRQDVAAGGPAAVAALAFAALGGATAAAHRAGRGPVGRLIGSDLARSGVAVVDANDEDTDWVPPVSAVRVSPAGRSVTSPDAAGGSAARATAVRAARAVRRRARRRSPPDLGPRGRGPRGGGRASR